MTPVEGLPFKIDHRYDQSDELAQFAARMEHISPEKQEWMQSVMNGAESQEFLRGVLAGYAGVFALMQQVPVTEFQVTIHDICAFLASKIRRQDTELRAEDIIEPPED